MKEKKNTAAVWITRWIRITFNPETWWKTPATCRIIKMKSVFEESLQQSVTCQRLAYSVVTYSDLELTTTGHRVREMF